VQVPATRFFSLQKGPGVDQLERLKRRVDILDLAPELEDLTDTTAAIGFLDLVIAVDTSIAHLAGALAAVTWTLIPEPADFRWMIGREDSPWYPTMRLFRQQRAGDWSSVIQAVAEQLARDAAAVKRD
jgi:ADP-heptose:LPS heptosyltransferase